MTGDQLYDEIKELLQENRTPQSFYLITKFRIRLLLMEPSPQPIVYRWKRDAA